MGTVFLARLGGAGGFQRLYAIKRLHDHLARHAEFIEMFLDEARLAARIHHPNVVPILEIGTAEAGYYLVMEYVEGDTAGHLFHVAAQEGKVISPRVPVRIALDALAGLHAAHEGTDDEGHPLEIVHRDVSPHNILVSVDGVSKITDFGIAHAASRLAVTRTGQLKGKVAYMAPEQARSEKIDRRADIFAMGICLWEMMARQRLFRADAEGETLNRLLYEPIPSLRSVAPTASREIDAVCMRALERDLERRFATAAEFSEALESAASAAGLLGTHRDVSECIAEVLGPDLSERRSGLRAWIADTERRSLAPPADSHLDSDRPGPAGAMVSVYVPPLFDVGTLGAHAEGSQPSLLPARRRFRGLGVAMAAAAIGASIGGVGWWHSRAQGRLPSAVKATEVETAGAPARPPIPAESAVSPVIDAAPSPSSRATSGAHFAAATAAGAGTSAVVKSTHGPAPLPALPLDPPSTAARPTPSVPSDMLYNPYR
jgi:tRNA A-37 threonylcarbamoyl transferase component Bud32